MGSGNEVTIEGSALDASHPPSCHLFLSLLSLEFEKLRKGGPSDRLL